MAPYQNILDQHLILFDEWAKINYQVACLEGV